MDVDTAIRTCDWCDRPATRGFGPATGATHHICSVHDAAPDLLTRLKESTTALLITARLIESGGSVKVGALDEEAQRNRDVIAKAEEDK